MEEGELFSSNPISYKMDRKSPEAFELREAVNRKLFDFMGNYTDEVLAEYIVVLVCNGKHQNQARDDLEAFLGEDSGKFVAWLWDYLARENYTLRTPLDILGLKADVSNSHEDGSNKERQPSGLLDLHTNSSGISDIPLSLQSEGGRYNSSRYSTNSNCSKVVEVPESIQSMHPSIIGSLTKDNNERLQAYFNEVDAKRLQAEPMLVNKTSGAAYHTGSTEHFSSVLRRASEIPSGDGQLHDECQHQKIAKIDSSTLLHRSLPIQRTEPVTRGLRSIITEDHQSMPLPVRNYAKTRLSSAAVESPPQQIARPRGNVWDRLGKPRDKDDAEIRRKSNLQDNDLINMELMAYQGEGVRNPTSWIKENSRLSIAEPIRLDSTCRKVKRNIMSNECIKLEHSSNNVVDLPDVNNSKRKRTMYNELNSGNSSASFSCCKEGQYEVKETHLKMQYSFPVTLNRSQSLGKVTSDVKDSESTCNTARIEQKSQAHKVDSVISTSEVQTLQSGKPSSDPLSKDAVAVTPIQKLALRKSQLASNYESPKKAENDNTNHRPVKNKVLDVKSKLHQIETEVLDVKSKLCLKQTEMRNDAKINVMTGVQNHSEEDIESRTVLVTNVHFAATREALLSHFTKCGSVAKVVMLTDTITAQPKGAAYVVFAHKESVEKAVSMSGSSFFSRILTVMRKSEVPPDFLVPSPPARKFMQPFHPQSWKGSPHYSSSHLQWRRENPTDRESSISAATNGLESSSTGE